MNNKIVLFFRMLKYKNITTILLSTVIYLTFLPVYADENLPTLGQDARLLLSLEEEKKIGAAWMRQLNASGQISDDHIVTEYLQSLGSLLTSYIPNPEYTFNFFAINDGALNAFALLGGHIAVNNGLIRATNMEAELVAVMAHEIAHVKQHHIIRQVADSKRSLPIAVAGALASVLIGAPELILPIMEGHQERMLKFSRAHEQEADRIGIQLMARAGFNPNAMAVIFQRIDQAYRHQDKIPEYLMTHPVFDKRIADANNRAEKFRYKQKAESNHYELIKARLDVQYNDNKSELITLLLAKQDKEKAQDNLNLITSYQLAYTYLLQNKQQHAHAIASELVSNSPNNTLFQLLLADIEKSMHNLTAATDRLRQLHNKLPNSKTVAITFAEALLLEKRPLEANKALISILARNPKDPTIYQLLSQAASEQGNKVHMYEYSAEWYFLNNDGATAIIQLELAENLAKKSAKDTSRIKKRIQEITELQKKSN